MSDKKKIEVCFTPELFHLFRDESCIVVIVDILRATSAICTAFDMGAEKIIPVGTIEEAKRYKEMQYLVAAERDGVVLDFADFGNSPWNFTYDRVNGKTIVYSTTNGTSAIRMAEGCHKVVTGAYLNNKVLAGWLNEQDRGVIILCAGWKGKFSLEDTVYSGALCETLIFGGNFFTDCDSALASIDLWRTAKNNIVEYIQKASHRTRLKKLILDDILEYCHTFDLSNSLPVIEDGCLVNFNKDQVSSTIL